MTTPLAWRALGEWARMAFAQDNALDRAVGTALGVDCGLDYSDDADAAMRAFPPGWQIGVYGTIGGNVWTVNATKPQLATARQRTGRTLAGTILAAACEAQAQEAERTTG